MGHYHKNFEKNIQEVKIRKLCGGCGKKQYIKFMEKETWGYYGSQYYCTECYKEKKRKEKERR